MSAEIAITCDSGHRPIELGVVLVTDDAVAARKTRAEPLGPGLEAALVAAPVVHDDERGKWQIQCPICREDWRRSDGSAEVAFRRLADAGVSRIPLRLMR